MKCPKCGYVSYDYLDACRKCGRDLIHFKQEIGLQMLRPGELDLSVVLSGSAAAGGSRDDFTIDANFFGGQLFDQGGTVEADEAEFDISLDDDFPMPQVASEPAPTARTDVGRRDDSVLLEDVAATFMEEAPEEITARPAPTRDLAVDMIDMSDLEEVAELPLEQLETASTPISGGDETLAEVDLTMSDTLRLDDTLTMHLEPPPPERPDTETPTVMADMAADNLLDTELELELDRLEETPSFDAEDTTLLLDLEHQDRDDEETPDNPRPPERK